MKKTELNSLTLEELQGLLQQMGEKKFRGKQIFEWIHKKQASSIDDMTNLSKDLRKKLQEGTKICGVRLIDKLVSQSDGTTKYLFALEGDSVIESVWMQYDHGSAVCISTQVGCRMGCSFCASTLDGVERNLSAGEMLAQIYAIQKDTGKRVSSVVLMGSGEPLDNYDQVLRFLELIHHPDGYGLGHRHITLSTCGLVDKIHDLAQENLQITLAISLHAPNDAIRNQIMPVSRKYPMEQLLAAAKQYADSTKRRVTFEYALIQGLNDSDACARELGDKLRHTLCHVNLIPVNEVKEKNYKKSSQETVERFADILREKGIETTVRRKLGSDINAACGQLRRGYVKQERMPRSEVGKW